MPYVPDSCRCLCVSTRESERRLARLSGFSMFAYNVSQCALYIISARLSWAILCVQQSRVLEKLWISSFASNSGWSNMRWEIRLRPSFLHLGSKTIFTTSKKRAELICKCSRLIIIFMAPECVALSVADGSIAGDLDSANMCIMFVSFWFVEVFTERGADVGFDCDEHWPEQATNAECILIDQ